MIVKCHKNRDCRLTARSVDSAMRYSLAFPFSALEAIDTLTPAALATSFKRTGLKNELMNQRRLDMMTGPFTIVCAWYFSANPKSTANSGNHPSRLGS